MSFVGIPTSLVILYLEKQDKEIKKDLAKQGKEIKKAELYDSLNYRIMTIFSDKYKDPYNVKPNKERNFLGYKF